MYNEASKLVHVALEIYSSSPTSQLRCCYLKILHQSARCTYKTLYKQFLRRMAKQATTCASLRTSSTISYPTSSRSANFQIYKIIAKRFRLWEQMIHVALSVSSMPSYWASRIKIRVLLCFSNASLFSPC